MYGRQGVELSRSLLSGWVDACCRLLSPLEEALQDYVLTDGKLHADDTPVPVLLPGNKKTKTGRLWTYVRDDRNAGSTLAPAVWLNRPGILETKLPEKEVNRMTKNTRFSPEVRQRAIRMVLESQGEYDSQWAAICSIAPKIGCTPETLRVWVRQHERDTGGGDGGLTTAERQRLKELERENRELRRSNDILRQASAYFAKAEFDRLWKK